MRSIVFLQNRNFYGNKLIHIPLLYALKTAFKENEIIVFSPYRSGSLFVKIGLASSLQIYSFGLYRLIKKIRQLKPDLIISLRPASQWLDMVVGFSGAKQRLGFRTALSRALFTHTVPRDVSVYRAQDFLNILRPLGIQSPLEAFFYEQRKQATLRLSGRREWYSLIPGGGAGDFKRWSIKNFLELCGLIREEKKRASFVFVLGDKERDYVDPIKASSYASDSLILFKEKISNLSEVFASSRATVANDCGPAQVAQMMGGPYVGLFSDQDGKARELVAEWFRPHERAKAVISGESKDINSIPVERVFNVLKKVLRTEAPEKLMSH